MGKNNKKQAINAKQGDQKESHTQKNDIKLTVVRDFGELGRITSESLDNFFDTEFMETVTVFAKMKRDF